MDRLKENVVIQKSIDFAVRIANLYKYLTQEKKEYVMSKQLLRCGTSIGANAFEAVEGQSRADFLSKMNIALKESSETLYWLTVMNRSGYLTEDEYNSINDDAVELNKLLSSIVKSTKEKSKKDEND